MVEITGVVITLNEELNIAPCLESLQQVCTHLIVVDSGSQDATCEIAADLGAQVFRQDYLGDGRQKNFGIERADTDWVLSLDADERLTPEAITEIQNLNLGGASFDSFAFRRRNYIGSRWIKHAGWYPDYCVRLFRKSSCQFSESDGHAAVKGKSTRYLRTDILHYSYKNLGELFTKANKFSLRGAKSLYRKGKRVGPLAPPIHGLMAFFRRYILRGGFLGGSDGLTVALSSGLNSYMKYAKLRELQFDEAVRKELDIDSIW